MSYAHRRRCASWLISLIVRRVQLVGRDEGSSLRFAEALLDKPADSLGARWLRRGLISNPTINTVAQIIRQSQGMDRRLTDLRPPAYFLYAGS